MLYYREERKKDMEDAVFTGITDSVSYVLGMSLAAMAIMSKSSLKLKVGLTVLGLGYSFYMSWKHGEI